MIIMGLLCDYIYLQPTTNMELTHLKKGIMYLC